MPKISILMSVYEENNNFLKESIISIINQTYKNFEFIIVDDNTSLENKKIINYFKKKDARIKIIINKKKQGLTKSLNRALKISSGKYIARMDSDDISVKTRLGKQKKVLEKNAYLAGCGTNIFYIENNIKTKKIKTDLNLDFNKIKKNLLKKNQFIHPTLFIRKNIMEKLGGYNENFILSQDYDLILRLASKYKISNLSTPLLYYRINKNGLSYKRMKESLRYALKARWEALIKFNYPKWQIVYLIIPLLSYLLPIKIKLFILNKK